MAATLTGDADGRYGAQIVRNEQEIRMTKRIVGIEMKMIII